MTDTELLALYDEIAEFVDDEILDEADELFNIDENNLTIPETYYIWVAKKHLEQVEAAADHAVESTFRIVDDVTTLTWD